MELFMSLIVRNYSLCPLIALFILCPAGYAQQADEASKSSESKPVGQQKGELSVVEITSLLSAIDPYRPEAEVSTEIDVFGSTSMDSLAHGWVAGFNKFHPEAKVVISAEGSETAFDRLSRNPASIAMFSRPLTGEDIEKLKSLGLKNPVTIRVARDPLAVYVHESNPIEEATYAQLAQIFCTGDSAKPMMWSDAGVEGELADKPVSIFARNLTSGTQTFINHFLFHSHTVREHAQNLDSNADVIRAIAKNPAGIAIADLKHSATGVKLLRLRSKSTVFDSDEHSILLGRYPLIRPMTLVFDLGQQPEAVAANREFVRYALTQTGQAQTLLMGFYPLDHASLRGEMSKLTADSPSSSKVAVEPDKEKAR
jgi:phosphate transport system substrate-binding protein